MPPSGQVRLLRERRGQLRSDLLTTRKGGRRRKHFKALWMLNEGFVLFRSLSPRPSESKLSWPPFPSHIANSACEFPLSSHGPFLAVWVYKHSRRKLTELFQGTLLCKLCRFGLVIYVGPTSLSLGCSVNRCRLWCPMCVVADWCRGKRAIVMRFSLSLSLSLSLPPFAQIFFELLGTRGREGGKESHSPLSYQTILNSCADLFCLADFITETGSSITDTRQLRPSLTQGPCRWINVRQELSTTLRGKDCWK